jgi:hypothetical protein
MNSTVHKKKKLKTEKKKIEVDATMESTSVSSSPETAIRSLNNGITNNANSHRSDSAQHKLVKDGGVQVFPPYVLPAPADLKAETKAWKANPQLRNASLGNLSNETRIVFFFFFFFFFFSHIFNCIITKQPISIQVSFLDFMMWTFFVSFAIWMRNLCL